MKKYIGFCARVLSDRLYLRLMYFYHFKRFPDLKNPKTFNEKIQWLKLNDRKNEYVEMVDKIRAKDYVSRIIGSEHIVPTLMVWDSVEKIELSGLPDEFVLKTNHDSKGVVVCNKKESFDFEKAKEKLNIHLQNNAYWYGREWPYLNVEPKVFAEKYLENDNNELIDYKVHCFNGEPKLILVCSGRYSMDGLKEDFFSADWKHLEVKRPGKPFSLQKIEKPAELEEMLEYSIKLSQGIPFLRVDFYIVNGKVYFGELTFYPASGFEPFEPRDVDNMLGNWLKIDTH